VNPIFCAVDTPDLASAGKLVESLRGKVGGIKLGLEFFVANGLEGLRTMTSFGLPIFADMKFHDIPNTVAGALTSLLPLKPFFITLHASGGGAMMQRAAESAAKAGTDRPKLLAVTVLTSLNGEDLAATGQDADPARQVVRLATLAKQSGIDGIVCSAEEIKPIRAALGKNIVLMVPGIRPVWADANDQKRMMTPREAMDAGATHLVIGRPITKAADPAQAAERILAELA
jgi:orotidine-5'-phosphate decarboxylase